MLAKMATKGFEPVLALSRNVIIIYVILTLYKNIGKFVSRLRDIVVYLISVLVKDSIVKDSSCNTFNVFGDAGNYISFKDKHGLF